MGTDAKREMLKKEETDPLDKKEMDLLPKGYGMRRIRGNDIGESKEKNNTTRVGRIKM